MTRRSAPPRGGGVIGRVLRRVSGICAGGLAALAVGLVAVAVVVGGTGTPGPGVAALAWHVTGAVVAVAGQAHADRDPGVRGGFVAAGVIAVVAAVLAVQWLL
jgi:hypothetical protein